MTLRFPIHYPPYRDEDIGKEEYTKPPLPYTNGTLLRIYPHEPPLRSTKISVGFNMDDIEEPRRLNPLERCLKHPPSGQNPLNNKRSISMEIVDSICLRGNSGAQLLKVSIPELDPNLLVAKVYDSLYYKHLQVGEDPYELGPDPMRGADREYAYEAGAYNFIQQEQARLEEATVVPVPKYYGSFTFEIEWEGTKRWVRMILLELVPGVPMSSLNPEDLDSRTRKEIIKQIVEAETALFTANIVHYDLYPRNIKLEFDRDKDKSILRRVTIIDLAHTGDRPVSYMRGVPINPVLSWHTNWIREHRFFQRRYVTQSQVQCEAPSRDSYNYDEDGNAYDVVSWVDWDWNVWLEEVWGDSERYAPITPEMRDLWTLRKGFDPSKSASTLAMTKEGIKVSPSDLEDPRPGNHPSVEEHF